MPEAEVTLVNSISLDHSGDGEVQDLALCVKTETETVRSCCSARAHPVSVSHPSAGLHPQMAYFFSWLAAQLRI